MFAQLALALKPQLTPLANIFPFLIVPEDVSYRVRSPRVMFPAVRFVTPVDTGCELLLQNNSKIVRIREQGIDT
jgi:hypothetical protein